MSNASEETTAEIYQATTTAPVNIAVLPLPLYHANSATYRSLNTGGNDQQSSIFLRIPLCQ